jgi:hypothetical protein
MYDNTESLVTEQLHDDELEAALADLLDNPHDTFAAQLAKTTGISANVQNIDEIEPNPSVSGLKLVEPGEVSISKAMPKLLHPFVATTWMRYMSGTNGFEAAVLALASSMISPAIPVTSTRQRDTRYKGSLNVIVIGNTGSGKSRTLSPITAMQEAITTTIRVKDHMACEVINAWNALLIAVLETNEDSMMFSAKDCLDKIRYDTLYNGFKKYGIVEFKKKVNAEHAKFSTPVYMVTKSTIEKLVFDAIEFENCDYVIKRIAYASVKFLDEVPEARMFCDAQVNRLEIALENHVTYHRTFTNYHLGMGLDEINAYLEPQLKNGKAYEMCQLNERTRHSSGAKGDAKDNPGVHLEANLSVAIAGLTTLLNMTSLLFTHESFIKSGLAGRAMYIFLSREDRPKEEFALPEFMDKDGYAVDEFGNDIPEWPEDTEEDIAKELEYRYALAGILISTFPEKYTNIAYQGSAAQHAALDTAKTASKAKHRSHEFDGSFNRFEQNVYALAANATIHFAVLDDLAEIYGDIQHMAYMDNYTGVQRGFDFATYVNDEAEDSAKWWRKKEIVAEFMIQLHEKFGAKTIDISPKIPADIFTAAIGITEQSIETFNHMLENGGSRNVVQIANEFRASKMLRDAGDVGVRSKDLATIINKVLESVGAGSEYTGNDIGIRFRENKTFTSYFAVGETDRAAKRRLTNDGTKDLIAKLIDCGVIKETKASAGKKTKLVLTIAKVLSNSEVDAMAASLLETVPEE